MADGKKPLADEQPGLVQLATTFAYADAMDASRLLELILADNAVDDVDLLDIRQGFNEQWISTVGDLRLILSDGSFAEMNALMGKKLASMVAKCLMYVPPSGNNIDESFEPEAPHVAINIPQSPNLVLEDVEDGVEGKEVVREFKYDHTWDKEGLIYAMGTQFGTQPWTNPALAGYCSVTSSRLFQDTAELAAAVGRDSNRIVTERDEQGFICFDLHENYINPTHYTLRHYSSWDTECLRSWNLEASADGVTWVVLRAHVNDTGLFKAGEPFTWSLEPYFAEESVNYFSKFRLILTGLNSNNHAYLALSNFEVYGTHIDPKMYRTYQKTYLEKKAAEFYDRKDGQRAHRYQSDFDSNGIFYNLGTNDGTTEYTNPATSMLCTVTASTPMENAAPITEIVGRNLVRSGAGNLPYSWITVTLLNHEVAVSAYSLKHYLSWDTEALRHWKLRASKDGNKWVTLSQHTNDTSLNKAGETHTWQLPLTPITAERYSMFQIIQTGKNSNQHDHLCLSGFELYGVRYPKQGLNLNALAEQKGLDKDGMRTFEYVSDFDTNGILYFIGTAEGTSSWINPAERKLVSVMSSGVTPDSHRPQAWIGRKAVRCVTNATPNAFFMVDLKNYRVAPTAYTLRHYLSWDTEAIRSWTFLGSVDGVDWQQIRVHKNDTTLCRAGQAHTWVLKKKMNSFFRFFKVEMDGLNSNQHQFLALSGFEVYGTMKKGTAKVADLEAPAEKKNLLRQVHFLPAKSTPKFRFSHNDTTCENTSMNNKWSFVRTKEVFSKGKVHVSFKIVSDAETTNSWRIMIGISPQPINKSDDVRNRWIGRLGGWGYISGTGGVCHNEGKSIPYSTQYGSNDVVGVEFDFDSGEISFYKNGDNLGVAFQDLGKAPVYACCCMTAHRTRIQLINVESSVEQDDEKDASVNQQLRKLSAVPVVMPVKKPAQERDDVKNQLAFQAPSWDPLHRSSATAVMGVDRDVAANTGSNNKWTAVRALFPLETSGVQQFGIKVIEAPTTPNTWKLIVGLVPEEFTCVRTKHWIGAYGGYGYIAGTGYTCHNTAAASKYGRSWGGLNDTVIVRVDYEKKGGCINFIVNGEDQGVAFKNIGRKKLFPAVSLTATNSKVQIFDPVRPH